MTWSFRPRGRRDRDVELGAGPGVRPQEAAHGQARGARAAGESPHPLARPGPAGSKWEGTHGVAVAPTPVVPGQSVEVHYDGHLAVGRPGAVYLHAGYGPPNHWLGVQDLAMQRIDDRTWKAKLRVERNMTGHLNFCFRDDTGRWDNNAGLNWSYQIHTGQVDI